MAQRLQLHLLLFVLIPIQQCGGNLIDFEDIVYQFLLRKCSYNERLVVYDITGHNKSQGPRPDDDRNEHPPVTMEVGPVTYSDTRVQSLQLSAVYVQTFHNNQTDVEGKAQISEQVEHEDEYMWTVNKGLDFTTKVKFSIKVPLIYELNSEVTTSVKTGSGSTTVETRTTKQWIKQDIRIPPLSTIEAKWYVNEAQVIPVTYWYVSNNMSILLTAALLAANTLAPPVLQPFHALLEPLLGSTAHPRLNSCFQFINDQKSDLVVPWESAITLHGYVAALFKTPDGSKWKYFNVSEIDHEHLTRKRNSFSLRASGMFTANIAQSYHLSTTEKELTHRTANLVKYIFEKESG